MLGGCNNYFSICELFQKSKMSDRIACHEHSRRAVCGICFRKLKHHQKITPMLLALIQKHAYKEYSLDDESLPLIVCKSCAKTLKVCGNGRKLPDFDYGGLVKPISVNTRSGDNEKCNCSICEICRLNGNQFQKHEKAQRHNPGRPTDRVAEESFPITHCSNCHTEVGPGKPHECNRTSRQENLVELVKNHSEKTLQQVTSKLLDVIYEDKGVSKRGGTTLLGTKGAPKLVTVGTSRTEKPKPKYSIEDLSKLQVARNMSDNDTIAVASFLRVKGGRTCVERNLKQGLKDRNHKLEDMFYQKVMKMKEKPKKKKKKGKDSNDESDNDDSDEEEGDLVDGMRDVERPGIFVKDLDEFTKFLVEERGLDPGAHEVHFGFDDGQGMLKIMEIVKDKEPVLDNETKRSKYSDGVCPKSTKLSSVKKLFVVGLVPNVQELYPNVKAMLEELKLDGIEYGLCADIKIYLCIIGKQTASCRHPCPYCEGQAPWNKESELLTIGSLLEWHDRYVRNGSKKSTAKRFQNVVNPPLLTGDDDTRTLEKLNISELHCMTGSTGKLISEMERCAFETIEDGEKFINDFLKREDISKCVYQGSNSFEGNQARKLLQSVDKLERDVMNLDFDTAAKALPFVETLRKLDRVVSACFGQSLDPQYEDLIDDFSKQYRSLIISVTPKVNIL